MKNKTVAILLALFLGGFGIHQFYLGNNGRGVLYLVLCWTMIPALIAFFDMLGLIFMSQKEFERKYCY